MKLITLSLTRFFPVVFLLFLQLCLSACGSKPQAPVASAGAKQYEIKGKVVSVNKAEHKVTLDHEEIPGFMKKMTMEFNLYDDWVYDDLAPGALIQATLVIEGDKSWLQNPIVTKITDPSKVGNSEDGVGPTAGTAVPDFALVNQDGKKIHFKQYRGRPLLVTFIYTRCPLPDYCPLMSQNFARINKELAKNQSALKDRTHLLSISIDPEYDKPQVLREYGALYLGSNQGDGFKQWEFATGNKEQVKEVATFFGLNYWPEKGQVIHALRTALITPEGKVFKVYRGNDWKPEEVTRDIEKLQMAG